MSAPANPNYNSYWSELYERLGKLTPAERSELFRKELFSEAPEKPKEESPIKPYTAPYQPPLSRQQRRALERKNKNR